MQAAGVDGSSTDRRTDSAMLLEVEEKPGYLAIKTFEYDRMPRLLDIDTTNCIDMDVVKTGAATGETSGYIFRTDVEDSGWACWR